MNQVKHLILIVKLNNNKAPRKLQKLMTLNKMLRANRINKKRSKLLQNRIRKIQSKSKRKEKDYLVNNNNRASSNNNFLH